MVLQYHWFLLQKNRAFLLHHSFGLVGQDILIISIIKFILTASSNLIQDNSNFIASFALSFRALATFWVTIQRMSAKEAATIHLYSPFANSQALILSLKEAMPITFQVRISAWLSPDWSKAVLPKAFNSLAGLPIPLLGALTYNYTASRSINLPVFFTFKK